LAGKLAFVLLVPIDLESTASSRSRILAAGKHLFALNGYEHASTAAIAREALTSESQLVRYFGGKAGLLEAVFNASWKPLNERIQTLVSGAPTAREAMVNVLSAIIAALGEDTEIAYIFLFEGRRLRGSGPEVLLSRGFLDFSQLFRGLIRRGQLDGSFGRDLSDAAVAAALIGAAEGMIRERLIAERAGKPNPFPEREIRSVYSSMLAGLARSPQES
jgi:AcrR family transcriptional regulator